MTVKRGNCYVATEALWHILGGKSSPWQVHRMPVVGDTHWFLKHRDTGEVLDPSVRQFGSEPPDYSLSKRAGFLTKHPSRRAAELIETLTWQAGARMVA